ncbi:MAG TPA: class GN sortase [Arenicellales bacterium]|nr:class GN sortase [Arenicellales bacterium]HJP26844.1 class GN sortase [Arenicellales bacterium]
MVASIFLLNAGWIHTKALIGQYLVESAWSSSIEDLHIHRPWPWADTYPVARLRVPDKDVDLIVLSGTSGRTLAFGPGHLESSTLPGERGNAVISGHRDTHFRFLQLIHPGDHLLIDKTNGETTQYKVIHTQVVESDSVSLGLKSDDRRLTLVTCWPFDVIPTHPNNDLRYVVEGIEI